MKDLELYLNRYGTGVNGLEAGDRVWHRYYIEDKLVKAVYENCKDDGMMTRVCNGLMRSGIVDMQKLIRTSVEDLEKIRNFGASAVNVVRRARGEDLCALEKSTIKREKIDLAIREVKSNISACFRLGLNERAFGMREALEVFEKAVRE